MGDLEITASLAILISTLVSASIAFVLSWNQSRINKKKTAQELLLNLTSAEFQTCESVFLEVADKGYFSKIIDPQNDSEKRAKMEVLRYLNQLELICVSIRQGIVNENVMKSVIGDIIVKRHGTAKPLIDAIRSRESDHEFFEHLEYIANTWRKDPIRDQIPDNQRAD